MESNRSYNGFWRDDLKRVPKLRTYKTFKTQAEDYILLNLQKSERPNLSQFIADISPLRVETGKTR